MRLNDPLITSFVYKEKEYVINLAFDVVLDTFDYLDNNTLRDHEKAEICLDLLLSETFNGLEAIELWNYIYQEFIEQEKKVLYDLEGNPLPPKRSEKGLIDLEQDAGYIYSSFLQAYQIDLYKMQGTLHWSVFCSLLHSLPQDTIMQQIIQIRKWEPSSGESNQQKQRMRELQEIYALEDKEVD